LPPQRPLPDGGLRVYSPSARESRMAKTAADSGDGGTVSSVIKAIYICCRYIRNGNILEF
jgi:hypothetical protein